jgi:Fe-S cluster assembly protein SufD
MTARLASKPDVLGEAAPGSSGAARAAQPAPFPTRAEEEWRYADLDALKPVWEQASEPERIEVAADEALELVWLPSSDAVQVRRVLLTLGSHAKARIFALNIADQYGRVELEVELAQGADFELHAANIGTGVSINEVVSIVRHLGPDGRSRQVVRSVLGGKAVGSYLGRVAVARGAQQTDGEQSVKAVLLDRGATANARPELEIYADDVKCAHGATVGELDREQMFYATSRGLPPAEARALLLEGFVMDLWEDIGDEAKRDAISTAARDALRRVSQ